jgi:hypothetical protein
VLLNSFQHGFELFSLQYVTSPLSFQMSDSPPSIGTCNEPLIDSKYDRLLLVHWTVAELA